MLGFFFVADDAVQVEDAARAALRDDASAALDAAISTLEAIPADSFTAQTSKDALQDAIVDGLGIKPKFAYTPLRTAISGRRVSPPLFESMEILGKDSTLTRLRALRSLL